MDTTQTLSGFGYQNADLLIEHQEDGRLVALFTVPDGDQRQAMTAFITPSEMGFPRVEVLPGFVIED